MNKSGTVIKDRVKGSLYGFLVGDAVAVSGHWFYSPTKLRREYGEIPPEDIVAPKPTHPESMVQGMSYRGTIDIMHDKAQFYEGNTLAAEAKRLSQEEIRKREDDHGNYVGAPESERVHYHRSLLKGQNTANVCLARLNMRYLAEVNAGQEDRYDPDEFLQRMYIYMTTKPDPERDKAQWKNHNDTYLDVYLRGFFTRASEGLPLRLCALSQRETWSIGSLDGVVMTIPMIAAYANEPEAYVIGRAVEHHILTHKSVTVTAVVSVLVPLLLQLYQGDDDLRGALDRAMIKMRPPKMSGREQRDSYVSHRGPGNIPKHEKWKQHMVLASDETVKDLVHRMVEEGVEDEDVAGWGDRPNSRLSTACYCEQAFTIVLFLAYKYADDPKKALVQNLMLGGHSTARGAVLGAILGAAHGRSRVPFVDQLCASDAVAKEVDDLLAIL